MRWAKTTSTSVSTLGRNRKEVVRRTRYSPRIRYSRKCIREDLRIHPAAGYLTGALAPTNCSTIVRLRRNSSKITTHPSPPPEVCRGARCPRLHRTTPEWPAIPHNRWPEVCSNCTAPSKRSAKNQTPKKVMIIFPRVRLPVLVRERSRVRWRKLSTGSLNLNYWIDRQRLHAIPPITVRRYSISGWRISRRTWRILWRQAALYWSRMKRRRKQFDCVSCSRIWFKFWFIFHRCY